MTKYKDLFDLSKELHYRQQGRYTRLDQKAMWLLSAMTFLLGVAIYLVRWAVESIIPPKSFLEWLILISGIFFVAALFIGWLLGLMVIRVRPLESTRLDDSVLEFFDKNRAVDIYFSYARRFSEAFQKNVASSDRKACFLGFMHNSVFAAGFALLLFAALFGVRAWTQHVSQEVSLVNQFDQYDSDKRRQIMEDKDTPNKPEPEPGPASPARPMPTAPEPGATESPNPNVQAPSNIPLTEGFDSGSTKRGTPKSNENQ